MLLAFDFTDHEFLLDYDLENERGGEEIALDFSRLLLLLHL